METLPKLHHFKLGKKTAPTVHFLCIGAQRSGTTWLAWNLRSHPGIWIPPSKEIHYFSRSTKYPSPSHLNCRNLSEKLLGRNQQAQTWRWLFGGYAWKWLSRAKWREKTARLAWIFSYFFQNPNDLWYLHLFRQGHGRICGEVTPDYSLLETEDVARVASLLPNLKILFLLRNPIERVFSQIRYHMDGCAMPNLRNASSDELIEFATAPGQIRRGDYVKTFETWNRFFPSKNIHLAFFEDICGRPEVVLRNIQKFLGAECHTHNNTTLDINISKPVNTSSSLKISLKVIQKTIAAHQNLVTESASYFGGHALEWPKRLTSIAKSLSE